jgi:hypothetical protein
MAKAFVYEVRFLSGTENEYLLERVTRAGDRQGLSYAPDDVNWTALLSRQLSFHFLGRCGYLSVYLERSRAKDPANRGDKPYWSAYRTAGGVQVKTYLGQDLSISNLEAAAARVHTRLKEQVGLSDEELLLSSRLLSGKRKQQERMTHLLAQLESRGQTIADLRGQLTTKDQMLTDLRQENASKDQGIADLKEELAKRDQIIAKLPEYRSSQSKRRKPHGRRP